ncbi:MAG: glycoside hydrolase family 3 C-terminal domain-containing protein [Cyclobacteriaceae bacterium]
MTNNFRLFFSALVLFALTGCQPAKDKLPYQDTTLSFEERVEDLVSRMTLEEKVYQMINEAPAIERLGIPQYNWWNEGLHGMARAGLATVFPQAIGLGATWDENLMHKVATTISDETRAKHHNFVSRDKRFLYQGLTLWSPNINIFRDPRWGRGQETYGEDPYLTGRMGIQFVKGLQGDHPKYYKTIATVKHFAVHNGPEPERHEFNAITDTRDLWETYLPQFEMAVKEGGVYSAMCAYNRYNDEACCASDFLMNDILRDQFGFDGYIVSDCGAIEDIYNEHGLVDTPEEAAALAVKSGCDLNCGLDPDVYPFLIQAVEKGLIDENTINQSVKRLFLARFKLGMFDSPEEVPFAQIPYEVVDSEENRTLAATAAKKSMVLLKNEDNLLPLSKDVKNVAVIGPNANQWLMLLGNYNGVPADPITPLRGIKEKLPNANVTFAQGSELAEGMPMFYEIPEANISNLEASFYDNRTFEGEPLYTEKWTSLNANWNDQAPREDMNDDDFGARWKGVITPSMSGEYQLGFIGTMNTQLYLADSLIARTSYHFMDEYGDPRLRKSDPIYLEAGKTYQFTLDAGESYADATVQLVWAAPKPDLQTEAITAAQNADVVIMCMGLTARMEGEEMDVAIDGFRGGDRTKISLPKVQQELIKTIKAVGKPVVLVLLNGSALAINWSDENIPAILEAWYPGQAGGAAIADILFGDYNPAGRLPVTFYKSVDDLPPFEEYAMTGHTYRYFEGEPIYPFGYGLSYSTFEYSDLSIPASSNIKDSVLISFTVTNTSEIAGEEVVQLYVTNEDRPVTTSLRKLAQFERIYLEPGASKTLNFKLGADAFWVIDNSGNRAVLPGTYSVSVGGGQPKVTRQTTNIMEQAFELL